MLKAGQVMENAFKVSCLAVTPCMHADADLCCDALRITSHH